MHTDRLLTEREAAEVLRVHPDTLRRWRREGHGPAWLRVGRLVRYDPRALEAWARARLHGEATP